MLFNKNELSLHLDGFRFHTSFFILISKILFLLLKKTKFILSILIHKSNFMNPNAITMKNTIIKKYSGLARWLLVGEPS